MNIWWKIGVAFFGAGVATMFTLHPPLTSQDWASWVQAIGSIGAIVGAFAVAADHIRSSQAIETKRIADDQNQHDQVIDSILATTSGILNIMRGNWDKRNRQAILDIDLVFLRDCKDAIKAIPIFKVTNFKLAGRLLLLPQCLQQLENLLIEAFSVGVTVDGAVENAFEVARKIIDGDVGDDGKLL